MRRQLAIVVVALCAALSACAGGAASATPGGRPAANSADRAWGTAEPVSGLAALGGNGDARLSAVSCGAPGDCVAVGSYQLASGRCCGDQAFIVSQVNGIWGSAMAVPGIAALSKGQGSALGTVSCPAAGDCTAGGSYTSGYYPDGHDAKTTGFVISEVNGSWETAQDVPGLAALDTGGGAGVAAVSCAAPGDCGAGGSYQVASSGPGCCKSMAFVVSQVKGAWGTAQRIAGSAGIGGVSCAAPGDCAAVGGGLVVSQSGGAWGQAQELAPAGSPFGKANLVVVSCGAPGDCTAGGIGDKEARALLATEKGGVWRDAHEIPGTTTLIKGKSAVVTTMSCTSAGACTAGGYQFRSEPQGSSTRELAAPFLLAQRHGRWGSAAPVPGIGTLSKSGFAELTAVSCASPGNCAAAGRYASSSYNPDGTGPGRMFVIDEVRGVWGAPREVAARFGDFGPPGIAALSCPAPARCSAVGNFFTAEQERPFVISQAA